MTAVLGFPAPGGAPANNCPWPHPGEAKGTLMLKTPEGDLELQLPPSAVKGIKL